MSVVRVGSTQQFSENWDDIFSTGKKKSSSKKSVSKKSSIKKKTVKKSPKKKATAKKAPKKKASVRKKLNERQQQLF